MSRLVTKQYPKLFDKEQADFLFDYCYKNMTWSDGVRSRKTGFTRKACALNLDEDDVVKEAVLTAITQAMPDKNYVLLGLYLNRYDNGEFYTPAHSHPKQHQLVISLGATRTLKVGKKDYPLSNGDVIIFGSSTHSVPKEPEVNKCRISIATFMIPILAEK